MPVGDPRRAVVENEWLFPLRQRIQDLQQQLVVNQQGIMAIDLVIRNNVELMRGVDRATNVTVSALQVAVTLALALANQKITLDKILAVNETTDKLIGQTAERLRTQGVEIHKMASGTSLNIDDAEEGVRRHPRGARRHLALPPGGAAQDGGGDRRARQAVRRGRATHDREHGERAQDRRRDQHPAGPTAVTETHPHEDAILLGRC